MLRKLRITQRAMLCFGLLGLSTLILGLIGISQLSAQQQSMTTLGKERLPLLLAAGNLQRDFLTIRLQSVNYLQSTSSTERARLQGVIQQLSNHFDSEINVVVSMVVNEQGKEMLRVLHENKRAFDRDLTRWMNMLNAGQLEEANALRASSLAPASEQIYETLSQAAEFERQQAVDIAEFAEKENQRTLGIIIIAIGAALLGVVVLALLFSRSISGPLQVAVSVAQRVASGDLTQPIRDDGKDEASDLMKSLNDMQNQLRNTLSHISDSAHQLAATSEELNAVTHETGDIVQQQSSQMEQAATAVNELTVAIDEVAQSANATSQSSEQANAKAQAGQEKLEDTIQNIHTLADEISKTSRGIDSLANNVKNISQVLDVIRAIADQTNLLALNAAIEAARAGETGRGFAVVADEVRALAHRTQESTKEIERMIMAVQEETSAAVTNMDHSNQLAQGTLGMVGDMGSALAEITTLIGQINEKNLNIASAAEEQAMVAREVDQNLVSLRDLSFQTSAGANQTNASSTELARLAEELSNLLRQFRV